MVTPVRTREEVKTSIEEKRVETQQNRVQLAEKRANGLENHCTDVQNRLTSVHTKLTELLEIRKSAGVETGVAQQHLDSAKSSLASAQTACQDAVTRFNDVPQDKYSLQYEAVVRAREQAEVARKAFFSARKSLTDALVTLRTENKNKMLNDEKTEDDQ